MCSLIGLLDLTYKYLSVKKPIFSEVSEEEVTVLTVRRAVHWSSSLLLHLRITLSLFRNGSDLSIFLDEIRA